MYKLKVTSAFVFLFLFLFGCATPQVEKTLFDPKDFADQQTAIINETAELGPKSQAYWKRGLHSVEIFQMRARIREGGYWEQQTPVSFAYTSMQKVMIL